MKSRIPFTSQFVFDRPTEQEPMIRKEMIKQNILYPIMAGDTLNTDYFPEKHMPTVQIFEVYV